MDNNRGKISVIVPIYNGAIFLEPTLDSILSQTYPEFELILVDDGSTDNTLMICEEYARADDRIHVIKQQNKGMSGARDEGYKIAKGDFIIFIDSDDIISTYMFELYMQNVYDADFVVCNMCNFINDISIKSNLNILKQNVEILNHENRFSRYVQSNSDDCIIKTIVGMMIRKSFFEKIKPLLYGLKKRFPQNYFNDSLATIRMIDNASKIVLLNDVLYYHRISEFSDSLLIRPNTLHYELADVAKENVIYCASIDNKQLYDLCVESFYLVMLKLWYQVYTEESDLDKRNQYINKIDKYYNEYYKSFKAAKCYNIKDFFIKISIIFYHIHPLLWKTLVGDIRYRIIYKLKK